MKKKLTISALALLVAISFAACSDGGNLSSEPSVSSGHTSTSKPSSSSHTSSHDLMDDVESTVSGIASGIGNTVSGIASDIGGTTSGVVSGLESAASGAEPDAALISKGAGHFFRFRRITKTTRAAAAAPRTIQSQRRDLSCSEGAAAVGFSG